MIARIFFGVPVYTMDEKRSKQEACVSVNGRIDYVGELKTAIKVYPYAEQIKYDKGCILPGFIDAHLHLKEFSMLYRDLDFSLVGSREEILEVLKETVSGYKEEEWVAAGGCSSAQLEQLTAKEIDSVSPQNPVIIYSLDLETALVNSKAMESAGINKHRNEPLRGRIETDSYNIPTGILRGRAIDLVRKKVPDVGTRKTESALENGIEKLYSHGITAFCDCSQDVLSLSLKNLLRIYKIKDLRSKALLLLGDLEAQNLGRFGIPSGFGNRYIRFGGLKVILDGSLMTLTGYMSEPYRSSDSYGILLIEEEELLSILKQAYIHNIWVSVQATGDRANTIALDCFEKLSKEKKVPTLLKRIEYAQSLHDDDMKRFAEIGVAAVGSPVRIPLDRQMAVAHLGTNARLMYRFGGLVRSGAVFGIGSDAPMGSTDPFHAIYCAVERKDYDDGPEVRFYPNERLHMKDAVYAYTMGSAAACGMDSEIGSIETGKSADMVHVSHDIFTIETDSLREVETLHTIVEGDVVWEKKQ